MFRTTRRPAVPGVAFTRSTTSRIDPTRRGSKSGVPRSTGRRLETGNASDAPGMARRPTGTSEQRRRPNAIESKPSPAGKTRDQRGAHRRGAPRPAPAPPGQRTDWRSCRPPGDRTLPLRRRPSPDRRPTRGRVPCATHPRGEAAPPSTRGPPASSHPAAADRRKSGCSGSRERRSRALSIWPRRGTRQPRSPSSTGSIQTGNELPRRFGAGRG